MFSNSVSDYNNIILDIAIMYKLFIFLCIINMELRLYALESHQQHFE